MKNEIYFTTNLTESEHSFVEHIIKDFCAAEGWEVLYYRKFKEGHQPMHRECKIKVNPRQIRQALKDAVIEIDNANKKVHWFISSKGQFVKIERFIREQYEKLRAK